MWTLAGHFYQLLVLARRPQDFPSSRFLLGICLLAHVLAGFLAYLAMSGDAPFALSRAMLAAALVAGGAFLMLAIFQKPSRWTQVAITLLGGEAMIGFMSLPFVFVISSGISNIFLELSLLTFLVWQVSFVGHVWRHALDTNMLVGIVVALGLVIWYAWIEILLLPFPGEA